MEITYQNNRKILTHIMNMHYLKPKKVENFRDRFSSENRRDQF